MSRRSPLSYRLGVIAPPAPLFHLYAPRVAIIVSLFALLALRLTYIRILSIAVAILRHFMLSPPQSRRAPVLSIRRHGCAVRFDHRVVTMIICPSEDYVTRRRVGKYRRSASRLRRAVCAADVLRAIRRATDLSRRPRIAPLP